MPLNSKYFKKHKTVQRNEIELTSYSTVGYPIILFDTKTQQPIACLHFNSMEKGDTVIWKRSENDHVDFQGIINENGQEFGLTITNLTSIGNIIFNVSDRYHIINKINELRPNESYTILCDKKDNKAMTLNACDTTVRHDPYCTTGTYLYLSVHPSSRLTSLFKDTEWRSVRSFITMKNLRKPPVFVPYRPTPNMDYINDYDLKYDIDYSECVQDSDGVTIVPVKLSFQENNSRIAKQERSGRSTTMMDSNSAHIKSSNKHIEVHGESTGIEYYYKLKSRKCILCLSVNTNLIISNEDDTDDLSQILEDYETGKIQLQDLPSVYRQKTLN